MKALVQRVSQAAVDVEGERVAQIGPGMLVLLGVRRGDRPSEADRLADKVRALRIFDDAEGRMNEPLGEREVLCVSQFTLYGDDPQGQPPQLRRSGAGRRGRAALRPLLRAPRRRQGRLRRLHGRGPGQRRPGDADAGDLNSITGASRERRHSPPATRVEPALVEAVGGFLPELDPVGHDPDRAPVGRALDRAPGRLGPQALESLAQRLEALDRLPLSGDQRLQLVVARARPANSSSASSRSATSPCPRSVPGGPRAGQ